MMIRPLRLLLSLCFGVWLGLAQAADIDLAQPQPKAAPSKPPAAGTVKTDLVVRLARWVSDVPVGDVVGERRPGAFCSSPVPLRYTKQLDKFFVEQISRGFKDRATELGFSAPQAPKSVFDEHGGDDADLRVGATLLNFDYRTCGHGDIKGSVYAKVRWEAFSVRRQQVVYAATLEAGYAVSDTVAAADFDRGFVRAIVDSLLADPKFAELVQTGDAAIAVPAKSLPSLQIDPGAVVVGEVAKDASGLLGAVVTVESGFGSGSGFYISHDGYLLTNQHVVADAKFVRIKLPGGRSTVGEVVRVDKQRDVALLRTDAVSADVLALRREAARVGEDVYALGSPFGETLSGTLTHGVLSSKRVFEGVGYLQSDVAVNPGNSGGPLVDANGQVIGITQIQTSARGINLFIPIDDVLDKLALNLQPKATAPR